MEKRCLVSRGFLFSAVVLFYVFNNFVICVTSTSFRMKLDYHLFMLLLSLSSVKTELV